jgi:hypothetical protein
VFPQFASQNERGALEQQDANECFTQVLQMLAEETDVAVPVGRPPGFLHWHLQSFFGNKKLYLKNIICNYRKFVFLTVFLNEQTFILTSNKKKSIRNQ